MKGLPLVLVIAVASAALPYPAAAQRGLSVGISSGLSIADVGGTDAEQVDSRSKLTVGLYGSLGVSDRLALEVGAGYTQKGASMTGTFDGTLTYRFDYIEVPVLARYNLLPQAPFVPTLVAGVAPAFRLNSSSTHWAGTPPVPQQFVFPKSTDVGLVLGTSVGFNGGRHSIRFDARYTLGLTRFAKTQFTDTTGGSVENPDVDLKNRALTLVVSYGRRVGS